MKNKIIYQIIPLFILLIILNGCSDEFIDTKPLGVSSTETFYTTMDAADMAVTACYAPFSQSSFWDLLIMMNMGSIASDEAEAGAGGKNDIPEYQRLDQLRHLTTDATVFEKSYGFLYRTIGACNVAIERLPGITPETDPDNYDAALLKKRIAEAHFIRAFNYLQLTMMYGGVPLVDKIQTPAEYESPRADISEVLSLIKSDLEIAINDLPTRSGWGPENIGRVTKGAAQAVMAKTYLFESSWAKYHSGDERFALLNQEWSKVAKYAEDVINSGEYELVGINHERFDTWRSPETGGYQFIFMLDGDNSKEGILEAQNVQDTKGWWNTRGQGLTRWCAPRRIDMNDPTVSTADFGWGWWCPSQKLVDTYEDGDPRFKATVLERGDSILCNFAADGGVAWRKPNYDVLEDGTGLFRNSKKYDASYEEYWESTQTWGDGPTNLKLIRYADVVLFASEAYLELGDDAKALEYINMVRKRARESGDTGVPADLTSITHLDIENERLVELGLEGHRMFDVIRWNKGPEYLNHTLADGDQITYTPGKHEFYPLPQSEMNLNSALVQYADW